MYRVRVGKIYTVERGWLCGERERERESERAFYRLLDARLCSQLLRRGEAAEVMIAFSGMEKWVCVLYLSVGLNANARIGIFLIQVFLLFFFWVDIVENTHYDENIYF